MSSSLRYLQDGVQYRQGVSIHSPFTNTHSEQPINQLSDIESRGGPLAHVISLKYTFITLYHNMKSTHYHNIYIYTYDPSDYTSHSQPPIPPHCRYGPGLGRFAHNGLSYHNSGTSVVFQGSELAAKPLPCMKRPHHQFVPPLV